MMVLQEIRGTGRDDISTRQKSLSTVGAIKKAPKRGLFVHSADKFSLQLRS